MKNFLFLHFAVILLSSCDCMQRASGVVLDNGTKQPLEKVSLGKFEKEDTSNSYTRRRYTNGKGHFEYSSVGGAFGNCGFDLYFSKEGYETLKVRFEQMSADDTIYLRKKP
jgi:hypothetical protein